MNKSSYKQFLKSQLWKELAVACKHRDGYACVKCGIGTNLQAHHIRYPSDVTMTELDDLMTLCSTCHKKTHGIKVKKLSMKKRRKRSYMIPSRDALAAIHEIHDLTCQMIFTGKSVYSELRQVLMLPAVERYFGNRYK